ncbi:MAG: hypothetical protein KDC88_05395 [Ignavibacteriae bacterium]|nr:hypothetical protein [Ignavibacteriota bacterium]
MTVFFSLCDISFYINNFNRNYYFFLISYAMTISEFENKWISKIKNGLLKHFPDDFIESDNYDYLKLPGKPLLKGSELFGNYEIIDTDGIPLLSTDNYDKLKYVLYSNYNKPLSTKLLKDNTEIKNSVKKYEKHLDEILRMIINDFKTEFPTSEKQISVSSKIFQLLNLHRY